MTRAFFDTSALVRRYLPAEPDANRVSAFLADPQNQAAISELAQVEFASALGRRLREQLISAEAHRLASERFDRDRRTSYVVVAVGSEILAVASRLVRQHPVRTLDAVQIASALAIRTATAGIEFWTADRRQAVAAEAEGLAVVVVGG